MVDDSAQPGPSGDKRKRTSKDFSNFVTTDAAEVLRMINDPDFDDQYPNDLPSDSFDDDSDDEGGGVVRTSADVDIARTIRENADSEERAELDDEYNCVQCSFISQNNITFMGFNSLVSML